jgi:hypothetical protein
MGGALITLTLFVRPQGEEGAGDSTLAGSGFGGSGKLSDAIVAECRSEFATHVATLRAFIEEHNLRNLSPQGAPDNVAACLSTVSL